MQPLGLLAGLLGGYQQGRQLKQNRGIRQATLKAQQDDRERQYKLEQDKFEYLKKKDSDKPAPNIDTGPSLIFDRMIDPTRKYWESWQKNVGSGLTLADRRRVIDEGIAKMPFHRQQIQSALDAYGPQLGFNNADPDLFLGGMHGMAGVKFDPATGKYVIPEDVYDTYAPPVTITDKNAVRDTIREISESPGMTTEAARARMQGLRDHLAALYGKRNAMAEIPYLPGDDVQMGTKTINVDGAPRAIEDRFAPKFDDATNPFLGMPTQGGIARRTAPQQQLLGMFGTDAPGMFAPQSERDAYQDARYNAPQTLGTITDANFDPARGQFNMAPIFNPSPTNVPANFADPDKEFRRGFATRVLSGTPTTQEELGLQQFIQSQRTVNPNFDPFRNMEDLRFTLQLAGPNIAPTLHRAAAKMVTGEGSSMEFVPQTQKQVPVTQKFTIAPKASALSAVATAKLTDAKTQTEILNRIPNNELIKARTKKVYDDMQNAAWRQKWDQFKFNDESLRGWQQLGISRERLNFDIDKDRFDRWLKNKEVGQKDIKFIQSLGDVTQKNVDTLKARLNTVNTTIRALSSSQWINHTSLNSVDASIMDKVRSGQDTTPDEWNSLTEEQKMAVRESTELYRQVAQAATLDRQITDANESLDGLRGYEGAVRDKFTGDEARRKELRLQWKKSDPNLTTDQLDSLVAMGKAPGKKPTPKPSNIRLTR
jgi:hypothetical protein